MAALTITSSLNVSAYPEPLAYSDDSRPFALVSGTTTTFADCQDSPTPYAFTLGAITAVSRNNPDFPVRGVTLLVTMYNVDLDSEQYNEIYLNGNFLGFADGRSDVYSQTNFSLAPSEYTMVNFAGEGATAGVNTVGVVNNDVVAGWFTCTNWVRLQVRVNIPPVVFDQNFTVNQNQNVSVDIPGLLTDAYDLDPEDLVTVVQISTLPTHGTVELFSVNGSFQYTPNPDYFGDDWFGFVATDGWVNVTARVNITIRECWGRGAGGARGSRASRAPRLVCCMLGVWHPARMEAAGSAAWTTLSAC